MLSVPLGEGIFSLVFLTPFGATWIQNLENVSFWYWTSIVGCLFFSALFSASETALTALNYAKVHQLINEDNARYGRLSLWLEEPNRVLTTILIGNNVVNILASALTTSISEQIFGHQGVAIAVGVLTFVILVSGEVVPKTYAKHHAKRVAHRLFPFLRISYILFYPFTTILSWIVSVVIRFFGGNLSRGGPFITESDIEYMINLGTQEGVLDEEKEKLLQSILEFDDITIREIMVPRINMMTLAFDASPEHALKLAQSSAHSRIPVYDGHLDNIVGILYLRDLFRAQTRDGESAAPSNSFLSSDWTKLLRTPYFVPSTMKISDLLKEIQRRKKHIAIVVDEFGGTMGLVTLEDILEEIVGEIHDEFDQDEDQEILTVSENVFHASSYISVRELGEFLDVEFPDDGDYETLGGFVTALFGQVPQKGEGIKWNGFQFSVLRADEKHVLFVEIRRITENEPDETSDKIFTIDINTSKSKNSED